jgi:hypothetical protein
LNYAVKLEHAQFINLDWNAKGNIEKKDKDSDIQIEVCYLLDNQLFHIEDISTQN